MSYRKVSAFILLIIFLMPETFYLFRGNGSIQELESNIIDNSDNIESAGPYTPSMPDPEILIDIEECSDERIKFDYSAELDLSDIEWIGYWGHGIHRVDVYVTMSKGSTKYTKSENTLFGYGSFLVGEEYDITTIQGYHVALLFDQGFTDVEIKVKVSCNLVALIIPRWYDHTVSETTTMDDDDKLVPSNPRYDYDPSMVLQYLGDYDITFEYDDDSGWEGHIQCGFFDKDGVLQGTYGNSAPIIPVDNVASFTIPRTEWSKYPDCQIKFKIRAIDNDMDGGRTHDRAATVFPSTWTNAGFIFFSIGARFDKILTYAQINEMWKLSLISESSSNPLFQSLYINDFNLIQIFIANPGGQYLNISQAYLGFSCNSFITGVGFNPNKTISLPDNEDDNIFISEGGSGLIEQSIEFRHTFFNMEFFELDYIRFEFIFYYSIGQNWRAQSTIVLSDLYKIIKPPKPEINFNGFEGPMQSNKYIYKYKGESSRIYAKFKIVNKARIPLDLSQFLGLDETVNKDLYDKLEFVISRKQKVPINITKQLEVKANSEVIFKFEMNPITKFFIESDDILLYWSGIVGKLGSLFIKMLNEAFKTIMDDPDKILAMQIVSYLATGKVNSITAKKIIEKAIVAISIAICAIKIIIFSWMLLTIIDSYNKDKKRSYKFKYESSGEFIHFQSTGIVRSDFSDLNYEPINLKTNSLELKASSNQENEYVLGMALYISMLVNLGIAGTFYVAGNLIAGILMELLIYGQGLLIKGLWADANDDLPLESDYSEIYEPIYEKHNFTEYQPQNEFEESILDNINITNKLRSDIVAFNITQSRKKKAIDCEDYEIVLKQNEALYNYSKLISEDYKNLINSQEILNYHIQNNASYFEEVLIDFEDNISLTGFTDEEIAMLQELGYNNTEIEELDAILIDFTNTRDFSGSFNNSMLEFNESIEDINIILNYEADKYVNTSRLIINESINIKVDVFEEEVESVDAETLNKLNDIKNEIVALNSSGQWYKVILKSDLLIDIIDDIALNTNNVSYIEEYANFAQEYKNFAENSLKIAVYHLKSTKILDNEVKKITLICESDGAPTGDYILLSNCSWVAPLHEEITITQYDKTITNLIISTQDRSISPGIYNINLTLTKPNTDILIHSILTIEVIDDDMTQPSISINYSGDYTDGNSGFWEINVTDIESGIDHVRIFLDQEEIITDQNLQGIISKLYVIPVPNELGVHNIVVYCKNHDFDWINDQEINLRSSNLKIKDDDTIAPSIVLSYIGENTDEIPGYLQWEINDLDNGIGGDNDVGLSEINISVTYDSIGELESYQIFLPASASGVWNLPPCLGNYTFDILVRDNDNDRTIMVDSLTSELSHMETIIDDDIDPPELSNLLISPGIFDVNISFTAKDQYSGIGDILIYVNNELVEPFLFSKDNDVYKFILKNHWIFKRGFSDVEIIVFDADNDRSNDSLESSISGTFKNVLFDMYEYVDWQLEVLKIYIDENLSGRKSKCLKWKLSKAQEYLNDAFSLVENGNITCALYHEKIAKLFIQITEFRTEIYNKHHRISDEHTNYIIDTLHSIRNKIVIIMGASTGSEQGYDIAYIEVDLLDLSDFIEREIPYFIGKYLSRKVYYTSKMLEIAIFKITIGKDIKCILRYAQWKLEQVIWKINGYLNKGRISEDIAHRIIDEIIRINVSIEEVVID